MLRYAQLGIVELNVTDLTRSKKFYSEMLGLELDSVISDTEIRFRCTDDPYSIVLHKNKNPGLKRVGWELEGAPQFEQLQAQLVRDGVPFETLSEEECQSRLFQRAVRMVEPHSGATFEFYRWQESLYTQPWQPTVAKIQRLGHVALWSPEKDQCTDFLDKTLNFKYSDSIGGAVTFMRPFPNPYHHGIGIATGQRTGLHHVNFMVSDVDDVGRAFHRFNKHGVEIMKGIGRHPASGSIFLYFLDPDGLTLEYSFGMEEFPEVQPRDPRTLPLKPESTDIWLGPVDPRYATMGDVESCEIS
ncbi:MAG: VOC family protein [Porticoccaceae bacterium]|jgi:2,3-dihydroxy-p-cumate/2,3-dihydroxybenzoate 3,4-dioxygenase|nr:VOC family protein [Porticoccaceae bacterium]